MKKLIALITTAILAVTSEELCMIEQLTYLSETVAKHIFIKKQSTGCFFQFKAIYPDNFRSKKFFQKIFSPTPLFQDVLRKL